MTDKLKRVVIHDHLLLPFGTKRKQGAQIKDLSSVQLTSVAANGIYLKSDIPLVHIYKPAQRALRLDDVKSVFDFDVDTSLQDEDIPGALRAIETAILGYLENPTVSEKQFLNLYFRWLQSHIEQGVRLFNRDRMSVFNALLPIPELQIYVQDPLSETFTYEPDQNFRVDFGFWTGEKLLAVEIDGNEPSGYARDVRRDRMLRRAEVDVIHILNTEIANHGEKVIGALLPKELLYEWEKLPAPRWNPVTIPF